MRLTLTKQAEYALRILVWLAADVAADRAAAGVSPAHASSGPTNGSTLLATRVRHKAAALAAATDAPPVFATRVLALLQRQGLLFARAGQQGGYTLARRAADISLLEVIEAVEGPLVSRECVLRDGLCGADGNCLLHDAWSTARESLRAVLAQTSLDHAINAGVTATSPGAADAYFPVHPGLGAHPVSGPHTRDSAAN